MVDHKEQQAYNSSGDKNTTLTCNIQCPTDGLFRLRYDKAQDRQTLKFAL